MLGQNSGGYLTSVVNPAGETYQVGYTGDGLLTTWVNPRGHATNYSFDTSGLLTKHTDATLVAATLSRTTQPDKTEVSYTSGQGRITRYLVEDQVGGVEHRVNTIPGGAKNDLLSKSDGSTTVTLADGTVATAVKGPDPRFGMLAAILEDATIKTPAGLTSTTQVTRTATLKVKGKPLSLLTLTDTVTVNGRSSSTTFDATTREYTRTSPMGRKVTAGINSSGQVTKVAVGGLAPVSFAYDTRGRVVTVTQGTGSATRSWSLAYNNQGLYSGVTGPLLHAISLQYDKADRIIGATLPGNRVVSMAHDKNGNVVSLIPPGKTSHLMSYDSLDQTAGYTPPALGWGSTQTSYSYNKDHQLSKLTRPDGKGVTFSRDTAGRPIKVTLPSGTLSISYDARAPSWCKKSTNPTPTNWPARWRRCSTIPAP